MRRITELRQINILPASDSMIAVRLYTERIEGGIV